jgi:type VI secretion system protein ImpL
MSWQWLRNPKIASAIGFLILVMIIWFAGPALGLKSPESRAAWVFIIMLLWVVSLLAGKFLADRAGSMLERVLRRQSDDAVLAANPNARTEVAALRQRLLTAIDTLKTSKLGKTKGKAALYELPWYMIIGHPAAGKSSAILNSGLTFPFSDKGKSSIQGVGGTRNCDWFFATEGVLIDTAGRYSTQREDRPEWLEFLKLLKKHRSRAPVNGILVAVSLPELMQHQTEAFSAYARQIRERINEIDDAFGIKVPVYLVITKIDLLGGFGQFFEDLSEAERCQVWGATLTHEQGKDFDAGRAVGQHFDSLVQGLAQLGMDKLALNRGNVKRPALFAFPIEFQGVRESVCKFVDILFEDDPYHARPLLRGFYLTSALQEGNPRIAAGVRVSRQFDLPRAGFEMAQTPAANSFFLRELFRDVIFPDQYMVGRQSSPVRNSARLGAIAAGVVALALFAAGWTWSYIGNQKLMDAARQELVTARQLAGTGQLLDRLKGIELLQLRVEQLYRYRQEGHPWQLGLGLYQGDALERTLRTVYFAEVRSLMLVPVKSDLELKLANLRPGEVKPSQPLASSQENLRMLRRVAYVAQKPRNPAWLDAKQASASPISSKPNVREAGDSEQDYNALKTYLMLHFRERMDAPLLANQLPRHWQKWLESNRNGASQDEVSRIAGRIVAFYLAQITEPDLPLIENSAELVGDARTVLRAEMRRIPAKERLYNELKARANARFAPLTVGRILNNSDADLMAGSYAVPGAFTREAWDNYFRNAITEASKGELKGDDWVLAVSMTDLSSKDAAAEHNRAELEALYRTDYTQEWKKFLQGVAVHDLSDLAKAAGAMGRLGDASASPLKRILQRAAFETAWDNPSELTKKIESAKTSVVAQAEQLIKNTYPSAGNTSVAAVQYGEVGKQFSALANLAGASNSRAQVDGYLELLVKLKTKLGTIAASGEPGANARQLMQATLLGANSEFAEALYHVDNVLLSGVNEDSKAYLRPLLVRPLMQAFSVMVPVVEDDINRAWEQRVFANWQGLASKYPFANNGNEAQMSDIAKFLRPGDGVLPRFVDQYLGALVVRRSDGLTARTWANMGVHFSPTFLSGISRLLIAGSTALQEGDGSHFELQPIPTPGLSEILLEIDGQVLRYRNGPQPWVAFNWPNPAQSQGARLQAVSFSGVPTQVANYNGRLGLMRLLADARALRPTDGSSTVEWRFKPIRSDGKESGKQDTASIRFNYRPVSGANLLALSNLRGLSLPQRITH